ncbi:MAG: hypothetical protein ABR551_08380 [Gemmatimonadales bacterium]
MTTAPLAPASYELHCPDAELAAELRRWLDDSGLTWPGHFRINARLVDAIPDNTDPRESYQETDVAIQAGPPDHTVRIRWTSAPAEAIVDGTAATMELHFTAEALAKIEGAERGFLLVALLFILRRLGWYHVHGASLIDPTGRGWMFVGNSKTGKSTTSALLASHGWTVSTDDIAFLERQDGKVAVRGFRSPIALREGGRDLLAARGRLPDEGTELARRKKTAFTPESLGGRWTEVVVPSTLLFPTIGEKTAIEEMRPGKVLAELVVWSRWVMYEALHSQQHLDLLGALAAQSQVYRVTFGPDLMDNHLLLQELVPEA